MVWPGSIGFGAGVVAASVVDLTHLVLRTEMLTQHNAANTLWGGAHFFFLRLVMDGLVW